MKSLFKNKSYVQLCFLLFLIAALTQCTPNSNNSTTKNRNSGQKRYTTDLSNFDPSTGMFKVDKYTMGLWHFDKEAELLVDVSKNENYGIINQAKWRAGRFGKGLKFDGHKSYVQFPNSPSLQPADAITIELWIYIDRRQFGGFPVIIGKDKLNVSSGRPSFELYLNNNLDDQYGFNVMWRINTDFGGERNLPAKIDWQNLADDSWHYIAASYDGKDMFLFVDGKQVNSLPAKGKMVKNKNPMRLGRKYSLNSNLFNGIIDELRISNIARSKKAIQSYWQAAKDK